MSVWEIMVRNLRISKTEGFKLGITGDKMICNSAVQRNLTCRFHLPVFKAPYPLGFPGGASDKEPTCQCRRLKRCEFNPWVRKSPWRREWQPRQYCCLENPHGQRSLEDYSPRGLIESDTTEGT